MTDRVLTVRQPYADLEILEIKPVENRSRPVPSTLPQWGDCPGHGRVLLDYPPDGHIADDGPDTEVGMDHAPGCWGDCDRHGCPVPVLVQADPRYPCGPIEPAGPFPFRLWIHAAKQIDRDAPEAAWRSLYWTLPIHDNVAAIVDVDPLDVLRGRSPTGWSSTTCAATARACAPTTSSP